MRIFITGGAGAVGRAIAKHLLEQGHHVHLTDLPAETDAPHSTYSACDIMQFESLREEMRGCDAVVHMAALKNPLMGDGHDIYRVNVAGTFNVFEAAAQLGIKRIVQASSINALGCAWNVVDFQPQYLPVDEAHPQITSDPYSFSKQQIEEIGAYFWRRDGISSVALRFPWVYRAGHYATPEVMAQMQAMRDFLDHWQTLAADAQAHLMERARARVLQFRAERQLEYPQRSYTIPTVAGVDDHLLKAYMVDRFNLWASIDERDAALAVEQALSASFEGAHALFVNNPNNWLGYDSQTLARLFFPDVPADKINLSGSEALVRIQRARELIGFEPHYAG